MGRSCAHPIICAYPVRGWSPCDSRITAFVRYLGEENETENRTASTCAIILRLLDLKAVQAGDKTFRSRIEGGSVGFYRGRFVDVFSFSYPDRDWVVHSMVDRQTGRIGENVMSINGGCLTT
jgi:hypothetical protein